MKLANVVYLFWLCIALFCGTSFGKYVSGNLKTLDDWAFLTRFCFISGRGKYEYEIEFDRKYGEPQLLLYYDDKTQWPAVYKSGKTCAQKLSVLSIVDNQMITLSARSPYNTLSGCTIIPKEEETLYPEPIFPLNEATSTEKPFKQAGDDEVTTTSFDRFLKTTTDATLSKENVDLDIDAAANEIDEEFMNYNFTGFNETDVFNASTAVMVSNSRNGGGYKFKHDIAFENSLENSTEYKVDVEELFETSVTSAPIGKKTVNRNRRSGGSPYRRTAIETFIVRCHNAGTFISSRERWWYIAIASCGSGKGLDVSYRFKMTNGKSGDFWHEHFSADEMMIPPILLVEFIAYSLLLLALFFCTVQLKSLHLYHCTYRLFGFSVTLQWIGVLILGIAWIRYGITGHGPHTTLGALFTSGSEIAFLLLLLLMAKGYTITRARLSSCSIVKLTIFVNTYIVAYIILFVYQAEEFDPGEVLNLYESPAGFGLSLLRCIAWCAFMISTATTIRKNPEKSSFYYPFGLFGSIWLLGGPFLTLVGIGVLDAWVRESVMCGTFAFVAFAGHMVFLWLTWPSRANKSFPYHVRTNHVGIASEDDDGADYPRHTYEPSGFDQNIIIPLSRRTEELISGIYGQYVYEHQKRDSNVHSHCSFPEDPNAPPEILSTNQLTASHHIDDENLKNSLQNRFANYLQKSGTEDMPLPPSTIFHADLENQVDSGHPSIDSKSPSNNTTKSISNNASPKQQRTNSVESIKSNPFAVNGTKAAPNKIILEPIVQSLKHMKMPVDIPKHLFAAKKPQ